LGVILSLALVIVSSGASTSGGVGDRTYAPRTVADVRDVYRGDVGDLTLDLSNVPLDDLDDTISVQVDHGIGDLDIVLPRSADVEITVEQGLGDVDVLDSGSARNEFFAGTGSQSWADDGEAEFDLMIHNGVGDVEVSRG
jgi:predicted membrane protein